MIELTGVSKHYQIGPVEVRALDGVDLNVASGEFVVVLGPSGSGKTTMLNIIGALDTPTSGKVTVGGRDITTASRSELFALRRQTVSFIFQSFNLFPGLTALENVEFGIDVAGKRGITSPESVLEAVGLGDRTNHFPHELSGGESSSASPSPGRSAPATPFCWPTSRRASLTSAPGRRSWSFLLPRRPPTARVLVVTHNREISRIADRVVEMSSGHVVSDGPPPGGKTSLSELHW